MTAEASPQELVSGVYLGRVRHLRRHPRRHGFQYEMGMLVLDLDEVPQLESCSRWFSATGWAPLSFRAADYLRDGVGRGQEYCVRSLKKRVELMLVQLGAKNPCSNILFAGQIRHFGLYFSPVNFFFCYQAGQPLYLLAEVSNTPWNERHYYLVDLAAVDSQAKDKVVDTSDKVFHVSPFMDLNMKYFWRVIP
ncbi:MAG: DUF1365 domain-containing protein, partial [Shewanella sp.]|nr:DUF1365 domain-containing protein [Shewanella sp.]